MLAYPLDFEVHDDGIIATFPDIPGSLTDGDTHEEALSNAQDALVSILGEYMARRRDIPLPSAAAGRPVVMLPTRVGLKVALYRTMRAAGVTNTELGSRIGLDERQVRRMLDLRQRSLSPDAFDRAFEALGKVVSVDIQDAA
ncbi:HicB family protein [Azospirillum palustre]|uniref:HicB family protein n=1 Tax=Azospirillum palustre TaxID=2044885 RepID=A0A2B8BJU7_9PROT|nr:type II toxin-antitoxin system HicB family antitoxin [Azospirillum palustre]PGH59066.1 HicB family protein [Azospirillum palustre]